MIKENSMLEIMWNCRSCWRARHSDTSKTETDSVTGTCGKNEFRMRLLYQQHVGARKVGYSRMKWLDDVEKDLTRIDIRGWKKSKDKREWVRMVKKAYVLQGL